MNASVVKLRKVERIPITPALDVGEAARNLLKNGWTRLEYPTMSRRFERIVSSFVGMTNDENRSDYFITNARELDSDDEPDLGLIEKAKGQLKPKPRPDEIAEERVKYDSTKFTHHYKPRLLGYLGRKQGAIERHAEFFLENARMYSEATLLMLEICEELDRMLPGHSFAQRMRETDHDHLLRLLRYLCDGPTPDIAKGHRDKNFLTIHVRSDRGGLWLADNTDRIIGDAEETRANSVLIFFGRKAWETTRGRLKGIIHGVKDVTFDDLAGRTPRHTAVFFGHVKSTDEDVQYMKDNARDLTFEPHVREWASPTA